jgi:5'-3' exonuclease
MTKKYALIDTANTFFRARHIASRSSTVDEKIGMAIHLTLASTNQIVKRFGIDHVVFCLEGRSWRKDFYAPYKKNRVVDTMSQTEAEVEENTMFWQTYESFTNYLKDRTNCSVLRDPKAEADDLIARWIHLHPADENFIVSTDSDFYQLISPTVKQYSGVTGELITLEGYFDDKGRPVKDKKTKEPKLLEDPQYILFRKIMRGDATDNVFSAFPGVREKGSAKKAGLIEAYADRHKQGYAWNNMQLQRYTNHEGQEVRVKDAYERNRVLIDLTAQPQDVKLSVDTNIREGVRRTTIPQVGIHLMKFCGKYELQKIADNAETYARWLNSPYVGVLK